MTFYFQLDKIMEEQNIIFHNIDEIIAFESSRYKIIDRFIPEQMAKIEASPNTLVVILNKIIDDSYEEKGLKQKHTDLTKMDISTLNKNAVARSDITNISIEIKKELDKIHNLSRKDKERFNLFSTTSTGKMFKQNTDRINQLIEDNRTTLIQLQSSLEITLAGLDRQYQANKKRFDALVITFLKYMALRNHIKEHWDNIEKENVVIEIGAHMKDLYENLVMLNTTLQVDVRTMYTSSHYIREASRSLTAMENSAALYIKTAMLLEPNKNNRTVVWKNGNAIKLDWRDLKTDEEREKYMDNEFIKMNKELEEWKAATQQLFNK